jgi:hypothetical protein
MCTLVLINISFHLFPDSVLPLLPHGTPIWRSQQIVDLVKKDLFRISARIANSQQLWGDKRSADYWKVDDGRNSRSHATLSNLSKINKDRAGFHFRSKEPATFWRWVSVTSESDSSTALREA